MTEKLKLLFDCVRNKDLALFQEQYWGGGFDINEYEPGYSEYDCHTLLGLCCQHNLVEFVKILLTNGEIDVNKFLGCRFEYGYLTVIEDDPEKETETQKQTPLCYACITDQFEIVQELLFHPCIIVRVYYTGKTNDRAIECLLRNHQKLHKGRSYTVNRLKFFEDPSSYSSPMENLLSKEVDALRRKIEEFGCREKKMECAVAFHQMCGLYNWNGKYLKIARKSISLDNHEYDKFEIVAKNALLVEMEGISYFLCWVEDEKMLHVIETENEAHFIDKISSGQLVFADKPKEEGKIATRIDLAREDGGKIYGSYNWMGKRFHIEKNGLLFEEKLYKFEELAENIVQAEIAGNLYAFVWDAEEGMLLVVKTNENQRFIERKSRFEIVFNQVIKGDVKREEEEEGEEAVINDDVKREEEDKKLELYPSGAKWYDWGEGNFLKIGEKGYLYFSPKDVEQAASRYEYEKLAKNCWKARMGDIGDYIFCWDEEDEMLRVIPFFEEVYCEGLDALEGGDALIGDFNWMGLPLRLRKKYLYFNNKRCRFSKLSSNVILSEINGRDCIFAWDLEDELLRVINKKLDGGIKIERIKSLMQFEEEMVEIFEIQKSLKDEKMKKEQPILEKKEDI